MNKERRVYKTYKVWVTTEEASNFKLQAFLDKKDMGQILRETIVKYRSKNQSKQAA